MLRYNSMKTNQPVAGQREWSGSNSWREVMPAMNHIDGIAKLVTSLAVMIAAVAELVAAIAKYKAKKKSLSSRKRRRA